jgi:hypothetical protein
MAMEILAAESVTGAWQIPGAGAWCGAWGGKRPPPVRYTLMAWYSPGATGPPMRTKEGLDPPPLPSSGAAPTGAAAAPATSQAGSVAGLSEGPALKGYIARGFCVAGSAAREEEEYARRRRGRKWQQRAYGARWQQRTLWKRYWSGIECCRAVRWFNDTQGACFAPDGHPNDQIEFTSGVLPGGGQVVVTDHGSMGVSYLEKI